MKQRLTRKDLKRNDLVATMGQTVQYVSRHRRGATEAVAILAAAGVLVAGVIVFRAYRENEAGKELSAGLAALEVPLSGEPRASGSSKVYSSAAEREREAQEHFRRSAARRATVAGRAASVILAARDVKPPASGQTLERVAREGHGEIAAMAELDAARLLAGQGKTTEAVERLKRAIESPNAAAPKDALLFALAEIYEKAGSDTDARAIYQRLINDYPNSPYRADARQKLPTS